LRNSTSVYGKVTGGVGFIGSAVCRQLIKKTETELVNVDKLTYADNPARFALSAAIRARVVKADIGDEAAIEHVLKESRCRLFNGSLPASQRAANFSKLARPHGTRLPT
jgi:dTDP-D-glucose 4,6-dehydratase